MKPTLLIIALSFSFLGSIAQPDSWHPKNNFRGGLRWKAVSFSIGGKGYMGTGYIPPLEHPVNDFWEYDPACDVWTQKQSVPMSCIGVSGRDQAVGFSDGVHGYIGGGPCDDFYQYDPINNIWVRKTNIPTPYHMFAGVAFYIDKNQRGYVGTGRYSSSSFSSKFWEYDPAGDTWTPIPDLPDNLGVKGAREYAVAISILDKGFVGMGDNPTNGYIKDWWVYTPGLSPGVGTWNPRTAYPGVKNHGLIGFTICSTGYVGFGEKEKKFYSYNPNQDSWTQRAYVPNVPNPRYYEYSIAFSICEKGYMGLGRVPGQTAVADFWEYTVPTDVYHCPVCQLPICGNIKVLLDCYYLGQDPSWTGLMRPCLFTTGMSPDPLACDYVDVSAMSSVDHSLVEGPVRGELNVFGELHVNFSNLRLNNSYYLKLHQRNHIDVVSANPVLFTQSFTYDFSTTPSQAFQNNEATLVNSISGQPDGRFGMYAGDLNHDCSVDASDFLEWQAHNGEDGYIDADANGDGSVDASDVLCMDPGIQTGIGCTFYRLRSLESINNNLSISVFPNPVSNLLTISTNQDQCYLKITNMLGEVVYERRMDYQTTIQTSNYPKGIYFLAIERNGQVVEIKKIAFQ